MTPQAKNGEKKSVPEGRPGKGVKCEGQKRLFFIFYFYILNCSKWPLDRHRQVELT